MRISTAVVLRAAAGDLGAFCSMALVLSSAGSGSNDDMRCDSDFCTLLERRFKLDLRCLRPEDGDSNLAPLSPDRTEPESMPYSLEASERCMDSKCFEVELIDGLFCCDSVGDTVGMTADVPDGERARGLSSSCL